MGKSICPFSLKPIFLESTANQFFPEGTWCGGITPAQHAGGPGFNPQRVRSAESLPERPNINSGAWFRSTDL